MGELTLPGVCPGGIFQRLIFSQEKCALGNVHGKFPGCVSDPPYMISSLYVQRLISVTLVNTHTDTQTDSF